MERAMFFGISLILSTLVVFLLIVGALGIDKNIHMNDPKVYIGSFGALFSAYSFYKRGCKLSSEEKIAESDDFQQHKASIDESFKLQEPIRYEVLSTFGFAIERGPVPGFTIKHGRVTVSDFRKGSYVIRILEKSGVLVDYNLHVFEKES